MRPILSTLLLFLAAVVVHAADATPRFRTDADGGYTAEERKKLAGKPQDRDSVLQWFQLVDGEFPPVGSAHVISGELIRVDHLERSFHLRVDRDDSQDAGNLDLPVAAVLLPYGSVYYHGAPAALQDIPLGTHLHGEFYVKSPGDKTPALANFHIHGRQTKDVDFTRCTRLEDDFTRRQRVSEAWKIESVDLGGMKLTARLQRGGEPVGEAKLFDLQSGTRAWKGRSVVELDALQPGQVVLFNLTWATLFGPGRILEVWLDEESRQGAARRQTRRHHDHLHERGLPGWIEKVNDKAEVVTITFFDSFDPALFEELKVVNESPIGWPLHKEPKNPKSPAGTIAVAMPSLLMFDPNNDRHGGNILDVRRLPARPGNSGVQIDVECDALLEGFRPKRIVRFFPSAWKVKFPPLEEAYRSY